MSNRRAVAAAACAIVLATAGCTASRGVQIPEATGSPTPGYHPAVSVERGPRPPVSGAWLGAWVMANWQTPVGRGEAFDAFEAQVGAQLPIAHMFHEWTDDFPGPTEAELARRSQLLLLSWAGTDTRSITSGSYDGLIRERAKDIKALGTPVLLRFRWEMDRPNLAASVHSPADYIAAWKHTRAIFNEVGVTNAGWVWCPHVQGFIQPERDAAAYYPGDDQVEWLCTDVYDGTEMDGFAAQMNAFMAFAQKHPKPIIIGEFGTVHEGGGARRAAWLREVRTYTKAYPQIKALVYFAEKMNRRPFYDTTLADDPEALKAFTELASDPYFAPPAPSRR
jgi:hypothetical protein